MSKRQRKLLPFLVNACTGHLVVWDLWNSLLVFLSYLKSGLDFEILAGKSRFIPEVAVLLVSSLDLKVYFLFSESMLRGLVQAGMVQARCRQHK